MTDLTSDHPKVMVHTDLPAIGQKILHELGQNRLMIDCLHGRFKSIRAVSERVRCDAAIAPPTRVAATSYSHVVAGKIQRLGY